MNPESPNTPNSVDPNDKYGASGFSAARYVKSGTAIPYRINFENYGPGTIEPDGEPASSDRWASAPAQRVTISDQLSADLDWATFRVAEMGFGDVLVSMPPDRMQFQGSVSMTYNDKTFNVELEAGIDLQSGRVFATFQSIDPATDLPPDVLTGFLPPEDGTGRGKGHFSFIIRPKANLPTGTQIRNVALIEFDRQTVIATNQRDPLGPELGTDPEREALNTLDGGAPSSSVTALPAESPEVFELEWSGSDDTSGSGVAKYDLYVSENGGAAALLLEGTTETSMFFQGEAGKTYAFHTIAYDNVGNAESAPAQADAVTLVVPPPATLVAAHLFYNRSAWDGNNAAANSSDDAGIASDKMPLLPGSLASFVNYSSYSRGINGVIIDMFDLAGTPSASDFAFRVGNDNAPGAWPGAPAPSSISVRSGAGNLGSDRITIVWADNAIQKQWLQVTILATEATGLAAPETFYFGNAIGESGNSAANAQVDVSDENGARSNPRNFLSPAAISDRYDYNRDKRVDVSDENLARIHKSNFLTALKLIDLRGSVSGASTAAGLAALSAAPIESHSSENHSHAAANEMIEAVSAPELQIYNSGSQMFIEWAGASFILEETADLSPEAWREVPATSVERVSGSRWRCILQASHGLSRFYRLKTKTE